MCLRRGSWRIYTALFAIYLTAFHVGKRAVCVAQTTDDSIIFIHHSYPHGS